MTEASQPVGRIGPQTVVALLKVRAEKQPDNIAYRFISDNGYAEEVTYSELDQRARTIGSMLSGIPSNGRPVLLLYSPGLAYVSAFFGCLYAGAIAVPAAPPDPLQPDGYMSRLAAIVSSAQPGVVLTTPECGAVLSSLSGPAAGLRDLQLIAFDEIPAEPAPAWALGHVNVESAALLQYTASSVSAPQGVVITHRNLMSNAELLCSLFDSSEESRGMTWLPLHNGMGLIAGIIQPLYSGFPMTLMATADFLRRPLRWLQEISRTRATISGGPNFAYDLCVQKTTAEERLQLDLSSWQVAFNGSEAPGAQTMEHFAQAFEPAGFRRQTFQPCYGLAEATYVVTGGLPWSRTYPKAFDASELRHGKAIPAAADATSHPLVSCGYASVDHCRVVIVDPVTRTECAAGQVGEIWISGSSVARSYWASPEQTRKVFGARLAGSGDGPFARSGDLGFLWDHELFVTGGRRDPAAAHGSTWEGCVLSVHELEPGTPQHRVAVVLGGGGELDAPALGQALEALIAARVPGFPASAGEPGQRITGGVSSLLQDNDAREVDDAQLMKWLEHAAHEPLDLVSGQLARIQLYRKTMDETLALVVVHRLITDFWSMPILVRELNTMYSLRMGGIAASSPDLTDFVRHYCWAGGERVSAYYGSRQLRSDLAGWAGGLQEVPVT